MRPTLTFELIDRDSKATAVPGGSDFRDLKAFASNDVHILQLAVQEGFPVALAVLLFSWA